MQLSKLKCLTRQRVRSVQEWRFRAECSAGTTSRKAWVQRSRRWEREQQLQRLRAMGWPWPCRQAEREKSRASLAVGTRRCECKRSHWGAWWGPKCQYSKINKDNVPKSVIQTFESLWQFQILKLLWCGGLGVSLKVLSHHPVSFNCCADWRRRTMNWEVPQKLIRFKVRA